MKTIDREIVGGFVVSADNLMLLIRNEPKGGSYTDIWTVPGGGIDPEDESTEHALARELLEELELDLADATINFLSNEATGQSEKTINGERFLVNMRFHDYLVRMPIPAATIHINPNDEIANAQWFTREQLVDIPKGKAVTATLKKLGFLD